MAEATKRYAVVTGSNKGIGFEVCRQLASNGVVVVLTARDEKRGLEAVQKLKESGFSDHVVFHQLDVADPASIASLADFIKTQFGKLDILVNNAGISGSIIDFDASKASRGDGAGAKINWNEMYIQTYASAEECVKTNYYGTKRMTEAFLPLLQLSDSPRIVNVSSSLGRLEHMPSGWAKAVLSNVESLTIERLDEALSQFLQDYKEGSLEIKGWPTYLSAYIVSKAAINSYTRILAKKYPTFCINCVCPGYVKTYINLNSGFLTAEEGAASILSLALMPSGGPLGIFFSRKKVSHF